MRPTIFVMALLLLAGVLEPSRFWLIYMVVLTGIDAFRLTPWRPLRLRPRPNLRMATFVLCVLLLAGAIDPTQEWLIALTAVAGIAMMAPGLVSLDDPRSGAMRRRRRDRWMVWDGEPWR